MLQYVALGAGPLTGLGGVEGLAWINTKHANRSNWLMLPTGHRYTRVSTNQNQPKSEELVAPPPPSCSAGPRTGRTSRSCSCPAA